MDSRTDRGPGRAAAAGRARAVAGRAALDVARDPRVPRAQARDLLRHHPRPARARRAGRRRHGWRRPASPRSGCCRSRTAAIGAGHAHRLADRAHDDLHDHQPARGDAHRRGAGRSRSTCRSAWSKRPGCACTRDGTGDLPLQLHAGEHLAWLHLWPHVRPWRTAHPGADAARRRRRRSASPRVLARALADHAGVAVRPTPEAAAGRDAAASSAGPAGRIASLNTRGAP